MRRRSLLAICLLACFCNLSSAEQESSFLTKPYLQNPASDGVTIMWHTTGPAYGWVEYGETEELGKKADLVIDGLRNANTTIHKVPLRGLEPASTYHYRVCVKPILEFGAYKVRFSDVARSDVYTFTTFPRNGSEITCVILNDLHNNRNQTFSSLRNALPDYSEFDFSVFNGDCLSDTKTKGAALESLARYNEGVSAHSRPALYIRGNHEIRGAFARGLKTIFDYPEGEFFFAMTAGPARFIFLDAGEDKTDKHPAYSGLNDFVGYREKQREWLKNEIGTGAFQEAKYRILIHHMPLTRRPDRRFDNDAQSLWSPVLDGAPIDLAVCGHTHRYEFVPAGAKGNPHPVLIGGAPEVGKDTVIVLSANDKKLRVKVLNAKGEVIGAYEKSAGGEIKEALAVPD